MTVIERVFRVPVWRAMTRRSSRFARVMVLCVLAAAAALGASATSVDPVAEAALVIQVSGVRVVSGDTLEALLNRRRSEVGVLGIEAPTSNTSCGAESAALLRRLVRGTVSLEQDGVRTYDKRGRRLFYVRTADKRSAALLLVQAGVARASGQGKEREQLAIAQARAKAAHRGCLWRTKAEAQPAGSWRRDAQLGASGPSTARPPSPSTRVATSVPTGFLQDVVATGLTEPTAMAFLPDGRILIAEKRGVVRLIKNGRLGDTPVVDLSDHVSTYWDHGLLGLVADPQFAINGYVYLKYTYENDPADFVGPKTDRVTRIRMVDDIAPPGNETVILGSQTGAGCGAFLPGADCLPADGPSHEGGALAFAPDGALFVTSGEASNFTIIDPNALRAQDLGSLAGKLLRVSATGQGLADNPFYDGNPASTRSKIWAYGFRNPFRMALQPATAVPYVGNVGWDSYEAVEVATAGANFGWPCYEGPSYTHQAGYDALDQCQLLYAEGTSAVQPPLLTYAHTADLSASITGGQFYTGSTFPSAYRGAYFYGDYVRNTFRYATTDAGGALQTDNAFADGADGPVDIQVSTDGALYYLSIYTGQLRRITYVAAGSVTSCPAGQYLAEYFGNAGLAGDPIFRRCEVAIDTTWGGVGPGNGLDPLAFSVRWTGHLAFTAGSYAFTLRTADGARLLIDGASVLDNWSRVGPGQVQTTADVTGGSHEIRIEYHNTTLAPQASFAWELVQPAHRPPTPSILQPLTAPLYQVGDLIAFQGSAVDADEGALGPASLSWRIVLHHCTNTSCHTHTLLTANGAGGSFAVPDHGDAGYLEIVLTATDSTGLTGTASVTLRPQVVTVTLVTVPAGLDVGYGDQTGAAPLSIATIAGSTHTISISSPQDATVFATWSDGGAQQHDVTLGTTNATYTASMQGVLALSAAAPISASPGMNVPIAVTATGLAPTSAAVDVRVYGPAGDVVFDAVGPAQLFAIGQTRSTTATWDPDPSLPAGIYTVALAAYDSGNGALVAASDDASQVQLTGVPVPIDGGQRLYLPSAARLAGP